MIETFTTSYTGTRQLELNDFPKNVKLIILRNIFESQFLELQNQEGRFHAHLLAAQYGLVNHKRNSTNLSLRDVCVLHTNYSKDNDNGLPLMPWVYAPKSVNHLINWSKIIRESIGGCITDTEAHYFKGFNEAQRADIWYATSEKHRRHLFKNSDYEGKFWIIRDTEYDLSLRELFCFASEIKFLTNISLFKEAKDQLLKNVCQEIQKQWWEDYTKEDRKIYLDLLYPENTEMSREDVNSLDEIVEKTSENIHTLHVNTFDCYPILKGLKNNFRGDDQPLEIYGAKKITKEIG